MFIYHEKKLARLMGRFYQQQKCVARSISAVLAV